MAVLSGTDFVSMSTTPPVKSPCMSGVNVFVTVMLSIVPVGKMSMFTARFLGSADGSRTPFKVVPV